MLQEQTIAFLCSRHCPASVILRSYDWARVMRKKGECIITGNHSQIEKDVMQYLLKGTQPIIIVLARGLKKRLEPGFVREIENQRLLIATPFPPNITRSTEETATKRNEWVIQLAGEVLVAYAQPGGNVERLIMKWLKKGKKVRTFDVPENRPLIEAGAVGV